MKYCNSCGLKVDEDFPKCPHCACTTFYHVCPNCTEEYVGTYCPGCGTKYNAIPKTCPNCSNIYFTRACPNCGYNPAVDRLFRITEDTSIRLSDAVSMVRILLLL